MWWNTSYLFRRNLNLYILDPLPVLHPVTFNMDPNILVTQNKVRSDLADLQIVYEDDTQATPVRVPVATYATNVNGKINIAFKLVAPLVASSNKNYYLYYGNSALVNVPTTDTYFPTLWPLTAHYDSPAITYKRPGEEWTNGVTTTTYAKASFNFSGVAVQLVAESSINAGIISLQLDLDDPINIDLYSNAPAQFQVVHAFTNITPGLHTLRVINTGQSNPGSHGTKVAIQRFDYLGVVVATDLGEEITNLSWSTNVGGTT